MALININKTPEYASTYIIMKNSDKEVLFENGKLEHDWLLAIKYFLDNHEPDESLRISNDVEEYLDNHHEYKILNATLDENNEIVFQNNNIETGFKEYFKDKTLFFIINNDDITSFIELSKMLSNNED